MTFFERSKKSSMEGKQPLEDWRGDLHSKIARALNDYNSDKITLEELKATIGMQGSLKEDLKSLVIEQH